MKYVIEDFKDPDVLKSEKIILFQDEQSKLVLYSVSLVVQRQFSKAVEETSEYILEQDQKTVCVSRYFRYMVKRIEAILERKVEIKR